MLKIIRLFTFVIIFLYASLLSAQDATLYGIVKNESDEFIEGLSVEYKTKGVISSNDGSYEIKLPSNIKIDIAFSHLTYVNQVHSIILKPGERKSFDLVFKLDVSTIDEVELVDEVKRDQNITTISSKNLDVVTGPTGGVEALISTLAGVSTKNEMSSQYSVRGGNFDENLVYVNGFEVYRPFLVRSGEQEGLSFINSNMVENIEFSSGGFDAKYGDKLSSVLDIKYKDPKAWKSHVDVSFMGLNATIEGVNKSNRWSHVSSFRQKTNQFLLNSLDVESDYKPSFKDFQSLHMYHFNDKATLSFLGHYSSNRYHSVPQTRESNFGTVDKPLRLNIYFDGQEKDAYESGMGAVRFDYKFTDSLEMSLSTSLFQTLEEEFYDIEAQYWLGALENSLGSDNFGEVVENRGIGGYLRHARNELYAQIYSVEYRGKQYKDGATLDWGFKYQHEYIDDHLKEWQLIDSSGFSMPQMNDTVVELFEFVAAKNELNSDRLSAYLQQSGKFMLDSTQLTYSLGFRSHYWSFNGALFVSPRASVSYVPNWEEDILFRMSLGSYNQSPFYRELRDKQGVLYPNLKPQKSTHFVLSTDYNFESWGRPFKFVGALYYKALKDIIPYEIDNLRIRYLPNLTAVGYTHGVDLRVNGEFVPGVESWASMSVMSSKENIKDDGYGFIARPTDQRFSFSLFFQDYFPRNPSYKMNLKLHYSTGLPTGATNSERYEQTIRIPSYRRVDIGMSKVLKDGDNGSKSNYLKHFDSVVLSAEVFNLLGIRNTISYLWVADVSNNQYAVPNYLTSRILNLKIQAKF